MASFVRLWPPAKTFCFAFNWFLQEEERRTKKRLVPELAALTQWESSSESGMERMKGNNFSVINLTTLRLILIIGTFVVHANTELNDLYEIIPTSKANSGRIPGAGFRGNPIKTNLYWKKLKLIFGSFTVHYFILDHHRQSRFKYFTVV